MANFYDKLGRNYILTIGVDDDNDVLSIGLPFTVEFDITRNIASSANVCQIRIYNLSELTRNQIRFNSFDTSVFRSLSLKAGYQSNLAVIFEGNITQAWSVREGNNFVTTIEAFAGGFAFLNGYLDRAPPYPSGITLEQVLLDMAQNYLPGNLSPGAIGSFPQILTRSTSYSGPTIDTMKDLTGGRVFVDNNRVNCLGDYEYISGQTPTINSASGLLNTPYREETLITFDMIFEPNILPGQRILLDSLSGGAKVTIGGQTVSGPNFNGYYKVNSVKHRGTISAAVCGDAVTSLGMFYSPEGLAIAVPLSDNL